MQRERGNVVNENLSSTVVDEHTAFAGDQQNRRDKTGATETPACTVELPHSRRNALSGFAQTVPTAQRWPVSVFRRGAVPRVPGADGELRRRESVFRPGVQRFAYRFR